MPRTVGGLERHGLHGQTVRLDCTMTDFSSLEQETKDGITILTVKTPVIDVNVMKDVHAAVSSTVSPNVILVLRLVRQILHSSLYEDQEGLGPLILLHKQMNNDGRRLVLSDLAPVVREAFHITRLDQFFEIHADANSAVIAMQQQDPRRRLTSKALTSRSRSSRPLFKKPG